MMLIFGFLLITCKKSEFLDKKPDAHLLVPVTVEDFQNILDNNTNLNDVTPILGEVSSDDYYIISSSWPSLNSQETTIKNVYTWNETIFGNNHTVQDWSYAYRAVFYANICLDGLKKLDPKKEISEEYANAKGSALFFRAEQFYQLAQVFARPYDRETAASDLGIVLKMSGDINEKLKRASVKATYDQIIEDLKNSLDYLPLTAKYPTRPSKHAAFAALARVYLSMQMYDDALFNASECLKISNVLLDYNDLTWVNPALSSGSIKRFNPETIFYSAMSNNSLGSVFWFGSNYRVESSLFNMYQDGDIRKVAFFRQREIGKYTFKGSYSGGTIFFGGLTTAEVLLTRAECYARNGEMENALKDLNTLMIKRWRNDGSWVPFTASTSMDALQKIMLERRKELLFRGRRWGDLRRLSKEGASIILRRSIDGIDYTLEPNSPRYTLPIPPEVMAFHPDMPQIQR